MSYEITVTENVTLVILNSAPSDLCFVSSAFEALAAENIIIDMISQSPPQGSTSGLAFTLSDQDLGKALTVVSKLREVFPQIKIAVSSGNSKLLISGENMKNNSGIAAQVFKTVAKLQADVRLITTSEIDISILMTQPDTTEICSLLSKELN